jgi:hypothetical protein
MNITQLKVWHWTLIGSLVGAVLAFAGPGPLRNRSADKIRTISQHDFEEAVAEDEAELGLSDEVKEPLPDEAAVWAPPPAIRELSAAPLEPNAAAKAEAEKDFGGEFYPTVVHHETPHISITEL